jgi:predicted ester cyclase
MSSKENKEIVRSYMNALTNGNGDQLDQFTTGNGNKRFLIETVQQLRALFPDIRLTIEDQVAEGDKVVTRVTFHGTHLGEYPGIRPTGKKVSWQGIGIDRLADGKIVEMWHEADTWSMMRQIGMV